MTATFQLEGTHRPVLVLKPESGDEAILMAAFIRYDSNVFSVSVERYDNGQIKQVLLLAEQSN